MQDSIYIENAQKQSCYPRRICTVLCIAARFKFMENTTWERIYSSVWLHLRPINGEAEMILKFHLVLSLAPSCRPGTKYLSSENSHQKYPQPPTEAPFSSSTTHSTCAQKCSRCPELIKEKTRSVSPFMEFMSHPSPGAYVPPRAKHKQTTSDGTEQYNACDWMI